MEKCAFVLAEMTTILRGLMRGMDPGVLDQGYGRPRRRARVVHAQRPRPGRGAPEQLARRPLALDPVHRPRRAPGAQAGPRGALDAHAHRAGADGRGLPVGGLQPLSHRPRRGRHPARVLRPLAALRRRPRGREVRRRPAHRDPRARPQQGAGGGRRGGRLGAVHGRLRGLGGRATAAGAASTPPRSISRATARPSPRRSPRASPRSSRDPTTTRTRRSPPSPTRRLPT